MKRNFEEFDYTQFVKYIQHCEVKHKGTSKVVGSDRTRFTGTKSFEETIDFALYGWDAGIKELELEKDLIVSGDSSITHNVVGSYVDVGQYLSGNPDCMIQFIDEIERDKPELTIYVSLTYSAANSTKDALFYAKEVLKLINELNTKYAVKIIGCFISDIEYTEDVVFITIKEHYENLALNSLAFAFHPSFFRRLWFRHLETKDYWVVDYGRAKTSDSKIISVIKNVSKEKGEKWFLPSFQVNGKDLNRNNITKWNNDFKPCF